MHNNDKNQNRQFIKPTFASWSGKEGDFKSVCKGVRTGPTKEEEVNQALQSSIIQEKKRIVRDAFV